MECERDDCALHLVAATDRRSPPRSSASSTSSADCTRTEVSPGTLTGSLGRLRTSSPAFFFELSFPASFGTSRSRRFSL
eukprot:scaffold16900_cov105-Isochrysis_galbana.AAC.4